MESKAKVQTLSDHKSQIIKLPNGDTYLYKEQDGNDEPLLINLGDIGMDMMRMSKQDSNSVTDYTQIDNPILQWTLVDQINQEKSQRKEIRGHTTVSSGNEIIVFGGCKFDIECYNDIDMFNIKTYTWSRAEVGGIPPSPRSGHSATIQGSKMYVFGGSTSSGLSNELFYFDIETKSWSEIQLAGEAILARTNHKMILDFKGRLLIFGGYTKDNTPSNEIHIINILIKQWLKPVIGGVKPINREHFSMIQIQRRLWIFGGSVDFKSSNEILVFDTETMSWIKTPPVNGATPPPRQGHAAIRQGLKFYIMGGCDYQIQKCYSDTWSFDTVLLKWDSFSDFVEPRGGLSASIIGANIFLIGGLELGKQSEKNIYVFNTNDQCPEKCNSNGICRNKRCQCNQGYFENDCVMKMICRADCSGNGICKSDGNCGCFPGFKGDICEQTINCPNNCTRQEQGSCQDSGICLCNSNFYGDACQVSHLTQSGLSLICPNNCGVGKCDQIVGNCVCPSGYSGDACEIQTQQIVGEGINLVPEIMPIPKRPEVLNLLLDIPGTLRCYLKLDYETDPSRTSDISQTDLDSYVISDMKGKGVGGRGKIQGGDKYQTTGSNVEKGQVKPQGVGGPGGGGPGGGAGPARRKLAPQNQQIEQKSESVKDFFSAPPLQSYEPNYVPPVVKNGPIHRDMGILTRPVFHEVIDPDKLQKVIDKIIPVDPDADPNVFTEKIVLKFDVDFNESDLQAFMDKLKESLKTAEIPDEDIGEIDLAPGSIIATITVLSPESAEKLKNLIANHQAIVDDMVPEQLPSPPKFIIEKIQITGHELSEGMFGGNSDIEVQFQKDQLLDSIQQLSSCKSSCSLNGICTNDSFCLCKYGYTGFDCSLKSYQKSSDFTLVQIAGLAITINGLGFFLGVIYIVYLTAIVEKSNYMEIGEKEEEDED